jgi:hypothetical protein
MATATAQLVYDAARELLTGTIGSEPPFHLIAYSGGSRGHAKVGRHSADKYLHGQATTLNSRLATTRTRTASDGSYTQRGGTIPPGHYMCHYVAHHPTFGECIQLRRTADALAIHSPFSRWPIPHGRGDDFFIHGSGAKGSDGCLVPAIREERLRLNKAVKNFPGTVVLFVRNVSYQLPAELERQFAKQEEA